MLDNLITITWALVAVAGLASLFFVFLMPNASISGLKLKYISISFLVGLGLLLIFLIRLKSKQKDARLASLEHKLRVKSAEASLAVNLHEQAKNNQKIVEIDEKIKSLDVSVNVNDDKVKVLSQKRDALREKQMKIDADIKAKELEKREIDDIFSDLKNRLGD